MKHFLLQFICYFSLFVSIYSQNCNNNKIGIWQTISLSNETDANDGCYFLGITTNPARRCASCAPCPNNNLASKVIRVSGDWALGNI